MLDYRAPCSTFLGGTMAWEDIRGPWLWHIIVVSPGLYTGLQPTPGFPVLKAWGLFLLRAVPYGIIVLQLMSFPSSPKVRVVRRFHFQLSCKPAIILLVGLLILELSNPIPWTYTNTTCTHNVISSSSSSCSAPLPGPLLKTVQPGWHHLPPVAF
jgi:hypothetical protein